MTMDKHNDNYISSTVTKVRLILLSWNNDFNGEKEAIYSKLKPSLEKRIREKRKEFEIIDVSAANAYSIKNSSYKTCLDPLTEPNTLQISVIFLGDETGADVLPKQVHAREFEQLLTSARSLSEQPSLVMKLMTNLNVAKSESSAENIMRFEEGLGFLTENYVKDYNAVPAEYVLKKSQKHTLNDEENPRSIRQARIVLRLAAAHSTDLDESRKRVYLSSEMAATVNTYLMSDPEKTLVVVRQRFDGSNQSKEIVKSLLNLVAKENILYINAQEKLTDGANETNGLLKGIECHFDKITESCIKILPKEGKCGDENYVKCQKQLELQRGICQNKLKFFIKSELILNEIYQAVMNDKRILVLTGQSGAGATTLLAKVADIFPTWFPSATSVVVFLNSSPFTSNVRGVALFMLQQLCINENMEMPEHHHDTADLVKHFQSLLCRAKKPTLLAIDSMNSPIFPEILALFTGLDKLTNKNIRLIMTSSQCGDLQSVGKIVSHEIIKINPFERTSGLNLLTSINSLRHRTLTAMQRDKLFVAFSQVENPTYMTLLAYICKDWKSWMDVQAAAIPLTIGGIINKICDNLEDHYGYSLTWTVLSYLTISRYGLSISELCHVITADNEIMMTIRKFCTHDNKTYEILPLVLEMINGLRPLLSVSILDDRTVYDFCQGIYKSAIRKRYFETLLAKSFYNEKCLHKNLAVTFASTCAADSLISQQNHRKFFISRRFCNARALHELPYHLGAANDATTYNSFLCNADWLIGKIQLLGRHETAADFDSRSEHGPVGLKFIKESVVALSEDSQDVALAMLEKLVNVADDFPHTVGKLTCGLQNLIHKLPYPLLFPAVTTKPPFTSPVKFLAYSEHLNLLVCANDFGQVSSTRLDRRNEAWSNIECQATGKIKNVILSDTRNLVIVISESINVIHIESGREILCALPQSLPGSSVGESVAPDKVISSEYLDCIVSADGVFLAALEIFPSASAIIHIWNLSDGETITYEYNPFSGQGCLNNPRLTILSRHFVVFPMYSKKSADGNGQYKIYMCKFEKPKERRRIVESAVVRATDALYVTERGDKLAVFSANLDQCLNIKIYIISSGELVSNIKTALPYSQDMYVEFTSESLILMCDRVAYIHNGSSDVSLEEISKVSALKKMKDVSVKSKLMLNNYSVHQSQELSFTSSFDSKLIFVSSAIDSTTTVLLPNLKLKKFLGINSSSLKRVMDTTFGIVGNFSLTITEKHKTHSIPIVKPDDIADLLTNEGMSDFPLPCGMQRSNVSRSMSEMETGCNSMTSVGSSNDRDVPRVADETSLNLKVIEVVPRADDLAQSGVMLKNSAIVRNTYRSSESSSAESQRTASELSTSESESVSTMSGEYFIDEDEEPSENETNTETKLTPMSPNLHVRRSMNYHKADVPKLDTSLVKSSESESSDTESDTESKYSSTDSDASFSIVDQPLKSPGKNLQFSDAILSDNYTTRMVTLKKQDRMTVMDDEEDVPSNSHSSMTRVDNQRTEKDLDRHVNLVEDPKQENETAVLECRDTLMSKDRELKTDEDRQMKTDRTSQVDKINDLHHEDCTTDGERISDCSMRGNFSREMSLAERKDEANTFSSSGNPSPGTIKIESGKNFFSDDQIIEQILSTEEPTGSESEPKQEVADEIDSAVSFGDNPKSVSIVVEGPSDEQDETSEATVIESESDRTDAKHASKADITDVPKRMEQTFNYHME